MQVIAAALRDDWDINSIIYLSIISILKIYSLNGI